MSTTRAIIDALKDAGARSEPVVLATVVRIEGSSYGGVGTRMVVNTDGSTIGLVSGGCLESDLVEHARDVLGTGQPKVVTYDTRGDEDAVWGIGLGCNGVFDVLLEPFTGKQAAGIAEFLSLALGGDSPAMVATVIRVTDDAATDLEVGARALFLPRSDASGMTQARVVTIGGQWSESLIGAASAEKANAFKAGRRGHVREIEGREIAFEVLNPSVRLLICGSGPDVVPFVQYATALGWDVTVVDHRPITPEMMDRFPAARMVECADPSRLSDTVEVTEQTAAVIMSHNFDRDAAHVEALLRSPVAYIGILGPRARTQRMFARLKDHGIDPGQDRRVFAPVGLDIGGDGPDAIALAIIAEISAVRSGRTGTHLRDKRGPLH